MSFISGAYKLIVQKACIAGANAISSVDKNYTELTDEGFLSNDITGFINPSSLGLQLTTNTNIQGAGQGQRNVIIREFFPQFLRQAVYYNTVTIPNGTTSNFIATGLTLGTRAYINYLGHTGTRGPSPSGGLSLTEAQALPALGLSGATVTAVVSASPYVDGDGVVVVYFCLVDPR